MGVSGSGKTTIGRLLAQELGLPFFDADDFHSDANRLKMSRGIPLDDDDRVEWLGALKAVLEENADCVLACSALKEAYRGILRVDTGVRFVHLRGSYGQIEARMALRREHYMPVQLLKSQFEALEEPADAFSVDITHTPQEIAAIIRKGLDL